MSPALRRAHARMRRSHGLIRRDDAVRLDGMTPDMVDGLVRRGHWEVVQKGIYRVAGSAVPPEQPHLAAVWRAGAEAVLTADPVLGVLGVEAFSLACPPIVLCPDHRRVTGVTFEVRYRPALAPGQRAMVGPLPVANAHRALVDLAQRTRGKQFRTAVDAARRLGLVTPWGLREAASAALPQRGAQWVIETVGSGILEQESEPERLLAALFAGHEPPLEFQAWLLPGVRVDAVWRDVRLVIEYDGVAHHTLPTDRERDRARRRRLRAAGWSVLVITNDDLHDPSALKQRIIRARRRRLHALGRVS